HHPQIVGIVTAAARHEDNVLAVGRPLGGPAVFVPFVGFVGELERLAAAGIHDVNVLVLGAIGDVGDAGAIGRPANSVLGAAVIGQACRRAAACRDGPDIKLAILSGKVGDSLAVR